MHSLSKRTLLILLLVLLVVPAQVHALELNISSIYSDSSETGKLFTKYLEEYQKLHPDITLSKVAIRGSDKEKLFTLIAGGVGPDIIVVPQEYLPEYLSKGIVARVPDTILARAQEGFIPAAMELAKWQGTLYGWPTENQPQVLAYNRMLMGEAGLAEDPPSTWGELRAMAKKLAKRDAEGNLTQVGFGMNSSSSPLLGFVLSYSISNGTNPISNDLHHIAFRSPKTVEAVGFLRQLHLEDRVSQIEWPAHAGFQNNNVGLYYTHGPWEARDFRKAGADYENNFRTSVPPAGSTGQSVTTFYGYTWAVASYSDHQKEAFDFLLWLCNQKTDQGTTRNGNMMEALGSIPNTMADAQNQPSMSEPFMQGFLKAITSGAPVTLPALPISLDPLMNGLTSVLKGEISENEAMLKADQVMQKKLDEFFAE